MKSTFQTILVVICLVAFIGGVIVFSGFGGKGGKKNANTPQGNVVVWGVLPIEQIGQTIDDFNISNQGYTISYTEHAPEQFRQDLVEALANGSSPDVVIVSSEIISQIRDRLYVTPFSAYSERAFRDTYTDGAQLLVTPEGILGLPLLVDPLVTYYNRDAIAGANFVVPPATWDDLSTALPLLTKKDTKNAIIQSAIGLGLYDNVRNARDILSALFLQTGNSVALYNTTTKTTAITLGQTQGSADVPDTARALQFYTNFANPTSTSYTWNSALPNTRAYFVAGKSAFYIGRASELFAIQTENPNLNFDVAQLFQIKGATRPITYGSFSIVAPLKSSLNPVAGYAAFTWLATSTTTDALAKKLSIPPARRDLLLANPANPYMATFYKSALGAFSWPDPNPTTTAAAFRGMISNVTSGRLDATTAIYEATRDLQTSIR